MMRKNQKGFTLVELIIAVAILAIVTLAVCGFIVVGSRSYTSANTDILLQQEAQLALNQISDVIIDTTDSITYSVGTGTDMQNVLKDSEYGGEATDKCLVVINRTDTTSNNDNPSYWFYWQKDLEIIYFNELPNVDPSKSYEEIQEEIRNADSGRAILAEHVTDLNIDISQFEENRVVMISMVLKNGNREYSTSNNVTVRNRIALNVVDIDPMQRADDFLIKGVASVVLEPGDEYTFKPIVDTSSSDEALVWKPIGDLGSGTTASQSGNDCTVRVGLDEERRTFALRVERENEQYAGQNNRVGITVYVEVKRVNSVNLEAEGSVTTVEPGSTIKITGVASGWHLKDRDNSDSCQTVDITKDYDLEEWGRADGSADFTVVSWDASGATIKIGDTVTEGQTIIIEATSSLSKNKGYALGSDTNPSKPGIQGTLRLTVEGGAQMGDVPLRSDFKFGTDNDGDIGYTLDYMYSGFDYESLIDEFVVCVRVREIGETNKDNDKVIIYYTNDGKNIRFYPDMFGLDLTRAYNLYIQIIVPMPIEDMPSDKNQGIKPNHAYDQDLVDDYFAPGNLDSAGKYVGKRYDASALFYGTLNPPSIAVKADGIVFPNANPDYHLTKYLQEYGPGTSILGKPTLIEGGAINVDENTIKNQITFSTYKGEGVNPSQWEPVYVYRENSWDYEGNNKLPSTGQEAVVIQPTQDPMLKKEQSTNQRQAVGTYKIVPGFWYANNKNIRNYRFLYPLNSAGELDTSAADRSYAYVGDYSKHHYELPASVITIEFKLDEFNLRLPDENGQERQSFFPLPTNYAFPFAREISELQTTTWSFTKYDSSGNQVWGGYDLSNIMVSCQYYEPVGNDPGYYKIMLYTETRTGAKYSRHVYGEYKWQAGWDKWERQRADEYDENGEDETNIEIVKDGVTYLAYMPAPSVLNKRDSVTLALYQKNGSNVLTNEKINITYIGDSVKLGAVELQGKHKQATYNYGTYAYSSNSSKWELQTPGSDTKYEVVNGVVYVTKSLGCYIELPLPGTSEFPGIGNHSVNSDVGFYDEYCENRILYQSKAFRMIYSYDDASKTYTAKIVEPWNQSETYATFTWQEGQLNWQNWKQ